MDFKAKQQIIESIAREVDDLHPLLQSFLGKLDGIVRAEYTHGTQEKGADFVLTRFDAALESFHHIGVVVKKGKINNDITDISRQIEECGLPRLIGGGKEKVRLSEIWVINTSTISSNAKEKIYDNFTKQRIEFIDGEALTKLVDKHASFFWHQIPSPIGDYLSEVSRRLVHLEKESGLLGNVSDSEFYIEPDIQEIAKIAYVKNKRPTKAKLVNLSEDVLRHNVSVLEGEMGFGKSKTARRLCQYFCVPDRYNQLKVVPIYYSFRQYHEKKYELRNFLEEFVGAALNGNSDSTIKILLILDGIDEAATNGTWKTTLRKLITEAKEDQRLHLLFTSRPLRILDEDVDIYNGVRRLLLRPLSISKVIKFVEHACKSISVPRRIYEDLQRSDLFKQLPQSPIAAALLSSLIAQNSNDLPSNLTELYSKSIDYMLGRWDVQKGVAPEKEYQAAERVSLEIADFMLSNQLIWMSYPEAKEMVESWHRKRNTGVDLTSLLERVFNKSGIFLIDEGSNTISFRHRSFGEYLYARAMRSTNKNFDSELAFKPYWIECNFFYIGLLADCPQLLEDLFAKKLTSEAEEWMKILALPDYVLAGYQTEYSIVENNLYRLFLEAAELYQKIRRGETRTKLRELPEMHLLWFFQRIIRHCYNYDFLARAIDSTILKIDAELEDKNNRLYALFFASCFAAQLDNASGFEYIVKNYSADEIPLPISIAIKIETDAKKDFSKLPLLKTHEKRLRKLLSPSEHEGAIKQREQALINNQVADLFERPLRTREDTKK